MNRICFKQQWLLRTYYIDIKGLCMLATKQAYIACFDTVFTKTLTGFLKRHQHIDFIMVAECLLFELGTNIFKYN